MASFKFPMAGLFPKFVSSWATLTSKIPSNSTQPLAAVTPATTEALSGLLPNSANAFPTQDVPGEFLEEISRVGDTFTLHCETLLDMGKTLVRYLDASLMEAWNAVRRLIVAHGGEIVKCIQAHPYVSTMGVVTIAAATILYLLQQKAVQIKQYVKSQATPLLELMAPEPYCCPITQLPMVEPMITPSGNSFEREAIVKWISEHHTDPLTRQPLMVEQLIPNRQLKYAIEDWKRGVLSSALPEKI